MYDNERVIVTERRRSERRSNWVSEPRTAPPSDPVGDADADIKVSVILPAYNESAALPFVLEALGRELDDSYEVIVVDDGSTDETAQVASRYPCRLLHHERNYGKGAAVRTGLRAARGKFIVVMDADHTYPVDALPSLVRLSEQYDFIRGVRRVGRKNSPLLNRLGIRFFDTVLWIVHGLDGTDHLSGLYGLRRDALEGMKLSATKFDLEIEIAIKARVNRLRVHSLPINYERRIGDKKLHPWSDGRDILRQALAMALIYNPGLMFVVPGLLVWCLAATLTVILSQGHIVTPSGVRLDINSFVVAALGATIGFQLIVFGIAAALFAVECGAPPKWWLVVMSRGMVRFWSTIFGLAVFSIGMVLLVYLVGRWLAGGGGPFQDTRLLVAAGVVALWGMQITLTMFFISMFGGRLDRARRSFVSTELPTAYSQVWRSAREMVDARSPRAPDGHHGLAGTNVSTASQMHSLDPRQ